MNKKVGRKGLTDKQAQFLSQIVPLSQYIQEQVYNKAMFKNISSPVGVYASVVLADIIVASNWGEHPVSQYKFVLNGKNQKGNNLNLFEVDKFWEGEIIKMDDKEYRAYDSWLSFALNWSDHLVFSGRYINMLTSAKLEDHVFQLSLNYCNPVGSYDKIVTLIETYQLTEFDY